MKYSKYAIMMLFFIWAGQSLDAQNISLTLEVDQDTVKVGDHVTVTYTFSGARGDYKEPEFENLQLVGGPNYSSSIQIINGNMDQRFTYSYIFQLITEGLHKIPSAIVKVGNDEYKSPSMEIFATENDDWNPQLKTPLAPKTTKKKNVTQI